jgi:hypothetical protein
VIAAPADRATRSEGADAEHSIHGPKRAGRSDAEVLSELTSTLAAWIGDTGSR